MADNPQDNEDFDNFLSRIHTFFAEHGVEVIPEGFPPELIAEGDDSIVASTGFVLKGNGHDIPELLKQFMEKINEDEPQESLREMIPVVTDDARLVQMLQMVRMFQEYQGLLPSSDDDSVGMFVKSPEMPDEIAAHMDNLRERKDAGEEVSNDEATAALQELVQGMLTWMIENEPNPQVKKLMELMHYRTVSGRTSPAADQAIIGLFQELHIRNDLDSHVTELGIAMHHMATHHLAESGALDTDVVNTKVFTNITGLLNTRGEVIHNWTHTLLDCEPAEQHDFFNTLLMSLYIEGMMTGWYAAKDAQDCLGAEMHGK